jgi:hypothetical protein
MCFFGFACRFDEKTKVNLALVVTSVGISVYLVEIFLHVYAILKKPVERVTLARQHGIDFDARTKLQVIRDLRERGIDAYPIVPPCLFMASLAPHVSEERIYPLGGVSDKLTVNCNESGEWSVYHSDKHGFNNP